MDNTFQHWTGLNHILKTVSGLYSLVWPTLFLLYINNLPLSLTNSIAEVFADDSSLSTYNYNVHGLLDSLSDDLVNVNTWCSKNRIALNISKSKFMLVSTKTNIHHLTQPCPYIQFQDTNDAVTSSEKMTMCNCWQHTFLGYLSWKCPEKVQYLFVFAVSYR